MNAPIQKFDVDNASEAWDLGAVRYLLSRHAKARLIEMAGRGAINLVGHVLENGRRVAPPEISKYARVSEWIILGDLTLAVETFGRRRNIITALFSNDEAWQRHMAKNKATGRKLRAGFMARKHIETWLQTGIPTT